MSKRIILIWLVKYKISDLELLQAFISTKPGECYCNDSDIMLDKIYCGNAEDKDCLSIIDQISLNINLSQLGKGQTFWL